MGSLGKFAQTRALGGERPGASALLTWRQAPRDEDTQAWRAQAPRTPLGFGTASPEHSLAPYRAAPFGGWAHLPAGPATPRTHPPPLPTNRPQMCGDHLPPMSRDGSGPGGPVRGEAHGQHSPLGPPGTGGCGPYPRRRPPRGFSPVILSPEV